MSVQNPTNVPASVRARLKNRADELGLEFNQALQYYAIERFLYRLSKTRWADLLVVKGAAMLRVWDGAVARPTRDIDFLARMDNSPEAVAAMVRECLSVESADGLEFSSVVGVEPITVEDRYPGARAIITGTLSGARISLQLDIGVGDSAVPEPGWVDYPTLLDMGSPRVLAYQPVTAVAEKLHAMISKGLLNSRVKDYYDIWMLASSMSLDGSDLCAGIAATFGQRGTTIPRDRPNELGNDYVQRPEAQAMWAAFIKRLGTTGAGAPSLAEAVELIATFVMPAAAAAASGERFAKIWTPGRGWASSRA